MTARLNAISSEPATRFLALVQQSGLLTSERVASLMDELTGQGTAEGVAGVLVRERYLTPFQARQLLRGRHAGFFPAEKFKVLDVLGEGGMGRVLLCEHLLLQKLVAVKQLHPTECGVPGSVERFLREARAIAKLEHPNVVRVMDVDSTGKGPLIVMDYVDGTNLHALIADHGKLPVPTRRGSFTATSSPAT
jgi:serine/threonine protein kinase